MQITRIRYTRTVDEITKTWTLTSKPMQGASDLFIGVISSDFTTELFNVDALGAPSRVVSTSKGRTLAEAKKLMKLAFVEVGVTFTEEARNRGGKSLLDQMSDAATAEDLTLHKEAV